MTKRILLVLAALLFAACAHAQAAPNKATITFVAPATRLDGTPITGALSYNVYQGVGPGTAKTKVGTITTTSTVIQTGLLSSTNYCWQVTAFEGASGPESAMSNEGCKAFGASPPGTVTITVQ